MRTGPYGGSPRFGSAHLRLREDVLERTTFCYPDSVFEPTDARRARAAAGPAARCARPTRSTTSTDYVEAHVHGGVLLERDVEAIVLDPCFRGGPVEAAATAVAPVEWHPGFRVATAGLDAAYRGPSPSPWPGLLGPELTPDVVGDAARSGRHDPQTLKRVWHHLARFGRPQDPSSATSRDSHGAHHAGHMSDPHRELPARATSCRSPTCSRRCSTTRVPPAPSSGSSRAHDANRPARRGGVRRCGSR